MIKLDALERQTMASTVTSGFSFDNKKKDNEDKENKDKENKDDKEYDKDDNKQSEINKERDTLRDKKKHLPIEIINSTSKLYSRK